jgi:hypothetical protein
MYKRLFAVLLPVLVLLTVGSTALASSGGPSGRFRATIKTPATIKGVWTISFANGHDSDFLNGKKVAAGTYTRSGSIIAFAQPKAPAGQKQCRTPGKYRYTLTSTSLSFVKISDPCNAIRSELLARRFTKL